jgi:hypothetical protein
MGADTVDLLGIIINSGKQYTRKNQAASGNTGAAFGRQELSRRNIGKVYTDIQYVF